MQAWPDFEVDPRRPRWQMWLASALGHLVLLSALVWVPASESTHFPQAISVTLLAAPPVAPPPAATPVRKPAVKPAPKPPPPPPRKVKVLPKQAPAATAKPRPVPRPEPAVQRKPRPEELSYDDALAKLRGELGENPPAAVVPVVKEMRVAAPSQTEATTAGGGRLSPEVAAWQLAVKRHVRRVWITPPEFRESGLATELAIDVAANGSLLGRPELLRSSGNPFYDDNAVRALVKASPLPPPPVPGRQVLVFTPEE